MLGKCKKQELHKFYFLLLLAAGAATLAGCVGKKYGFPGFGTKQASQASSSEVQEVQKDAAEKKKLSQEKKPTDLNHVASGTDEKSPAIVPASSSHQKVFTDDSFAGVSHVASGSDTTLSANVLSANVPDVDPAFQKMRADNVTQQGIAQQGETVAGELGSYEKLVSDVETGSSSLEALKASLAKLNETKNSESASSSTLPVTNEETFAQFVSRYQEMSPEAVEESPEAEEAPGIAKIADVESADKSSFSLEFPWFGGSDDSSKDEIETAHIEKEIPQSEPGRIQKMLTKARSLLQENNLLDARIIAETASALRKKTEAVFSPEEITPEQILEEIAMRERERKAQLLASMEAKLTDDPSEYVSDEPVKSEKKLSAPVVIDLNKQWLNETKTSGVESSDEIARFEQSIAISNQAARLPTIVPAGEAYRPHPSGRTIEKTSYDASGNVPERAIPALSESKRRILLLGEGTGGSSENNEEVSFESGSSLPMMLPVGAGESGDAEGVAMPGEFGQAPQLIAPGISSGKTAQADSDFDEFAAGFAEMGIESSPEIEEAPLLIDEEELQSHATGSFKLSSTMISLIVCGIALAAFMLVRWRR